MARQQTGNAVRITTANASRVEDIQARQRRYLVAMGVRTACFLGAIFVADGWWRWVLVLGAVLLPYVAVVMANASPAKSDGFSLMGGPTGVKELPTGTDSGGHSRADHL